MKLASVIPSSDISLSKRKRASGALSSSDKEPLLSVSFFSVHTNTNWNLFAGIRLLQMNCGMFD